MRVGDYARLAVRESRRGRGRVALFVACIAVGVAAVVVVAGLSSSVKEGVAREGRRLMAADVVVEGRRPAPAEMDAILARFGKVERAEVREFVSVVLAVAAGNASQLAEVKVVEGGYPFYGALKLEPARPLGELLADDAVVVAPELLVRLGRKVGEKIRLGGAEFRVAGVVLEEPDKLAITFTLGPRVFVSAGGIARTKLLDRGARVEYRALLKLPEGSPPGDAGRLKERLEAELPDAGFYRVRTYTEAQPALRRSFDRMGRYLGLVGLLSLLVGGVGVAQVARAWLASRMDDIAILRCLGVTPGEVVVLFLVQVVGMALLASVIGAALGTGLQWMVPKMLGGLLPEDLIRPWQGGAVARGIAMGLAVALVFTTPLLVGLRRVPPVRVLRRDAEAVGEGWGAKVLAGVLIVGGVWVAAAAQAESVVHGAYFAGGLVAAVVVLTLAAVGVSRIARLLPRDAGGVRVRHGLAHLARPGAATVGAIVALGLGVTFIFATHLVERNLNEVLREELPPDAPSTFLLDVQPDQWGELEGMLKRHGASGIESRPLVTARFKAIEGVAASELAERRREAPAQGQQREGQRPRRWWLTRELRVTYGGELPKGNRVVAGRFPSGVGNGISVEEGFARDLGVGLGSKVTLDVQGVGVEFTVTSLRTVDWRTLGINFFLFAEPGPLDDAPQSRVAVARVPGGSLGRVQSEIVRAFANVTVVHIKDVMDKVLVVIENLALAVRALGLFTVVAGVVVIGGTVAATQARRAREVALLKTVGMTRRDVAAVFAIEYALTGAVAAVIGVSAGAVLAWGALTQWMDLPWSVKAGEFALAVGLTVALAVGAGLAASARALSARPVEVLRAD